MWQAYKISNKVINEQSRLITAAPFIKFESDVATSAAIPIANVIGWLNHRFSMIENDASTSLNEANNHLEFLHFPPSLINFAILSENLSYSRCSIMRHFDEFVESARFIESSAADYFFFFQVIPLLVLIHRVSSAIRTKWYLISLLCKFARANTSILSVFQCRPVCRRFNYRASAFVDRWEITLSLCLARLFLCVIAVALRLPGYGSP